MREVFDAIPNLDVFFALEPEDLGIHILFGLKEDYGDRKFDIYSVLSNFVSDVSASTWISSKASYQTQRIKQKVVSACEEAISWLEHQDLIVCSYAPNGSGDLRRLSKRAMRFEDQRSLQQYVIARHLPRQILHPRLSHTVWMAFMRGEYDGAVFQAMKAVEVAVRDASGLSDLLGVSLMRQAFRPEGGPLTDQTSEKGEQDARAALFAGAIGSFKNPHSHRDVNLDDSTEATEVILLANHLLRIVDGRRLANSSLAPAG